jgi:hypothetical protein
MNSGLHSNLNRIGRHEYPRGRRLYVCSLTVIPDVELASDVAETRFFQFLFGDQIVLKLGQSYQCPRDIFFLKILIEICYIA